MGVATALAWMVNDPAVENYLPSIALGDGLPNDALDGAQEVLFLQQARAASTQTLVETVHPTWTPEQVQEEVTRILDEGMFPQGGTGQGVGPVGKQIRDLLRPPRSGDLDAGAGIDPAPGVT